jgi:hypothetical protein
MSRETADPPTAPPDAERLIAELDTAMEALLALLDAETRLVRASKLQQAARLQPDKARLAQRYIDAIGALKQHGAPLARSMPERLERLRRRHEAFRENLRLNMAVLATAKSVSEGLVRSVATELGARDRAATYSPPGQPSRPAQPAARPVTLNRSL